MEIDQAGQERFFLNHAVGVIEEDQLIGFWGTQQEITEKKKSEEALRASQDQLKNVIFGAKLGTWDWDITEGIVVFNEFWAKMLGYEQKELLPKLETFTSLIHPDDASLVWTKLMEHVNQKTEFFDLEFRMKTKSGGWKWIHDRGRVVAWDKNNKPLRATGTHMDITEKKEAEILLRDSEALFRSLYENSALGIVFADKDAKFIKVNTKFCELLGYSELELVGKKFNKFTHPEDAEMQMNMALETVEKKEQSFHLEKRYIHKNGSIVWASIAMSFIFDQSQNFKYLIGIIEDITDKRKAISALKESEALQKAVLNSLPDLKFHLNKNGQLINYYASGEEEDDAFIPAYDLLGRNLSDIYPEYVTKGILYNVNRAIENREVQSFEFVVPINNSIHYYEARIGAINEEEVIAIIRNISARKKAQQSVQENIRELDIKNRQLQRYIDSNMELENFAYIASHDLREPVRTMRTFAQFLKKRHSQNLDESAKQYLEFIIDGSNHMNQLIQDLLTYSRVNSQKHTIEEVILTDILKEIKENLGDTITTSKVEISTLNLPIRIKVNPTKIKQLFQNLITNAIKFRKANLTPHIEISAQDIGSHWQFAVADNGIGINPDFHDQIFLLFKKLHSKKEYQGTGLGLAICKKVVEHHQGEIWIESNVDEGATFYFTISKEPKL